MELAWWVGDGDEWHHDQIQVDVCLIPTGVPHDSADAADLFVWCSVDQILFGLILDLCAVVSFSRRPTIRLGLIQCWLNWLIFGMVGVVMIPVSRIGDLIYAENNPMSKIQEEKWADGNSVWYCLFISQTMNFIWFIISHKNVKWHIRHYSKVVGPHHSLLKGGKEKVLNSHIVPCLACRFLHHRKLPVE